MPGTQPLLDPRDYIVGADGRLYDADGNFLFQVESWNLGANVETSKIYPGGSRLRVSIDVGVEFTLALTERVTKTGDRFILRKVMDAYKAGESPVFDFQGKVTKGPLAGEVVDIKFCTLDGRFELVNVQPGQVLTRPFNFAVNDFPSFQSYLE